MPRRTDQEVDDRDNSRKKFWQEAIRLSKKKEIKDFLDVYCEIVDTPTADTVDTEQHYQIAGRQKTKPLRLFRELIRDNIKPSFKNEKVPHAWADLDDKVLLLIDAIFIVSIPGNKDKRFKNQ